MSAVISSTPRLVLTFGLSALVLGGSVVGCTGGSGRIAAASDRNDRIVARTAERHADGAARALAKRDPATAIERAEAAVALAPRNADYRLVLGQAYQQAGRFASARDTFAEVLELTPGNGKAALSLALAQIATGDWSAAQATLARNAAIIPVGDLGLATALAGQWAMARVAAAADMSPADVDARLEQWAAFAQPRAASDQVASLLGVTAGADGGRPVALALNAPVPVMPAQEAPVRTAAVETPAPASPFTRVVFAPPQEVAQPLPTMLRAAVAPVRQAVALKVPAAVAGDWYVQIGAYSNVAVAKSGWTEATRRFAALTGQRPTGTMVAAAQGSLYRVSVGGFSRAEADRLCGRYRAEGGACFVRREAGDRIAQWLRAPVQVAAR